MMVDDPFELAAQREQELRRERFARAARRTHSVVADGSLAFVAVWAVFLAAHFALFGDGIAFFVHASVFGLFAVMFLAPTLTPSALWAPILAAHLHYSGWSTATKIHVYVFVLFFVVFAGAAVSDFRWKRRRPSDVDLG